MPNNISSLGPLRSDDVTAFVDVALALVDKVSAVVTMVFSASSKDSQVRFRHCKSSLMAGAKPAGLCEDDEAAVEEPSRDRVNQRL